ncbi:hypothetical protein PROVRETT_07100 [Providencia rettgeri DSM 1131]|nr:hypothetical protein PROVRETT_07100 [Providencia rettgeri DSM 1131]
MACWPFFEYRPCRNLVALAWDVGADRALPSGMNFFVFAIP